MNELLKCGCNSYRSCLMCEAQLGIEPKADNKLDRDQAYVYCYLCDKAYPGWHVNDILQEHPCHGDESIEFPGVFVKTNFISEHEEKYLIENVDRNEWIWSQSGRRKQNYGPKCNFIKRKCKLGDFKGFPAYTRFVQERFDEIDLLNGISPESESVYQTIEQCFLEYDPKIGSSIDQHIDDCWVWGERILTVSLLADSVLTMTYYDYARPANLNRYNLRVFGEYNMFLFNDIQFDSECKFETEKRVVVRIPMPRRSLLVLYGRARYEWEHRILREDIRERRVCIAYREFTPIEIDEKHAILRQARQFF